MSETSIKILQFAIASSGSVKIDHIGSGVGVIMYNAAKKTGVGLHILAPDSGAIAVTNPIMYANTAIPHVIGELEKQDVKNPFTVAIAGGAAMLGNENAADGVGQKVVAAVKDALQKASQPVKDEQTGGAKIRSITLDVETGNITIN